MELAIRPVVIGGFAEVGRHWRSLLRALIVPATILSAFEVAEARVGSDSAWRFAILAAQIPVYVLYAVSCHRIALLGDDSLRSRWGVSWTARETRFAAWFLVLGLLAVPLAMATFGLVGAAALLADVSGVGGLADLPLWARSLSAVPLAAPTVYVLSRASLVLPATAIDRRCSLAGAWELSRSNGWKLTVALAVPGLLLSALGYFSETVLGAPERIAPSILLRLAFCLVSALEVTVLSVAFRTLTSGERRDAADLTGG